MPKYSLFWPLERVIKCNIQNKRKFVDVRAKLFDIRAVSLSKLGINNVTKLFEDSAWDPSYPYWTGCSGSVVAKVVFAVCQYIKCSCRLEKLQQLTNFIVSCCLLVCILAAVKHFVIPFGRLHTFLYTKSQKHEYEILNHYLFINIYLINYEYKPQL